jgi:vacuolar-type H+-ATPase subunit H
MHNSTFTHIDQERIIKNANKRAEKIFEEAEEDWKKAGSKFVEYVEKGWM